MIYVVVEELIPEAHLGEHSHPGTLGVLAGFLVMMVLVWRWGEPMERRYIFRRHGPRTRGTLSGFTIPIPVFWSVIWDAGQWTARSFSKNGGR